MKIELVAPEEVFAGTVVELEVVIVSESITRIAFAEADVIGTQGWTLDGHEERWTEPRVHVRMLGELLLSAGSRTRCKVPVALAETQPPTHEMRPAFATLEVRVVVSIAGGRDVRAVFPLRVRAATPRIVVRRPVSLATRSSRSVDPRLEVSLASSRLAAGELMVGSVAVFHVDDKRPRQIALALELTLHVYGYQRHHEQKADPQRFVVEIPAGGAGRSVPFEVLVPERVLPSFVADTHFTDWCLAARIDRLELVLPLEILDASAGARTAPLIAAPGLAEARVAAVFEEFAAHHGWRAEAASIARAEGGVELRMAYDYRGADGTFLVAHCRYPSFGVGLDVLPSTGLRGLFSSGIQLGVPTWDERHLVHARNASQVVAPLRAVVPSLLSAGVLGGVTRWGDEELVIERKIVTLDTADLLAASDALARIAPNLRRARDLVSPPAELVVDLPAWRQLARRWSGDLRPGDLAIAGTLDGAPVRLAVRFDDRGAAGALAATVGPTATGSRSLAIEIAQPARNATACPAPLAELIATWPVELVDLRIADGAATAEWRWTAPAPYRLDVTHARTLVEALRAIVGRLEPLVAGPYR